MNLRSTGFRLTDTLSRPLIGSLGRSHAVSHHLKKPAWQGAEEGLDNHCELAKRQRRPGAPGPTVHEDRHPAANHQNGPGGRAFPR